MHSKKRPWSRSQKKLHGHKDRARKPARWFSASAMVTFDLPACEEDGHTPSSLSVYAWGVSSIALAMIVAATPLATE